MLWQNFPQSMKVNLTMYTFFILKLCFWSLQAINAGEGVEKREPTYTVGGNAN